ncbi:MAG: hypothetical protein A2158_05015 [Chloroflexi bacterium RBG_13_46_14]|nr:MAG: hypothetical protein A2158_05015 [Chloroflexi bacterium RBG_13_46_14]
MLRYLRNVVTLELDEETCIGCGMCEIVCPHAVFEITGQKATIRDKDSCMECGACVGNCPVNALKVRTGVGCAAGILMGVLGKQNECSSGCGVSPDKTISTQQGCCGVTTEKTVRVSESTSSCCGSVEEDNGKSKRCC